MDLIWVMSQVGQRAPKENPADGKIGETPEQVQASRYYLRLIKDGSLRKAPVFVGVDLAIKEEKKAGKK